MTNRTVLVFESIRELSIAAGQSVAAIAREAVAERGRFTLMLSGGSTPAELYRLLGTHYADQVPWSETALFWGDERFVPHGHEDSNFRMVGQVLLDRLDTPPAGVHPIQTNDPTAARSAARYEELLRGSAGPENGRVDLLLLGLGTDGHVASLFPGGAELEERTRWVVASQAPVQPTQRITVTFGLINEARNVAFLVAGSSKARVAAEVLAGASSYPASAVRPREGSVTWWMDRAAAAP